MSEIDLLKKSFKDKINNLISNNLLNDSKELIKEYIKINGIDKDIIFFQGCIELLENDLNKAEENFLKCYFLDNYNYNYNFNLGYLYKLKDNYINSYIYYKRAYELTNNNDEKKELKYILDKYNKLNEIKLYNKELIENKNKYKKVTIIIPTYNQKEYLKEAVNSCLNQNYINLEIIVADDCSNDGTYEMMLDYYRNTKIKYIRNEVNLGAGINSQNILDNHVDSKYVMILNHDDYLIDKNYINKAVKFLENNTNLSLVWANCIINNEISGEKYSTNYKCEKIINGKDYFLNYELGKYKHITGVLTTVFDFEKLKLTNFGNENTKSKDLFLYLNLMLVGDIGFIEDCVAVYRIHKNSISMNMPKQFDFSTIEEFEKLKINVIENKIFNQNQMDEWIQCRVYMYIKWRFIELWNNKSKKDAIELLIFISKKYKDVYEKILLEI